jgi:hypothetical protein
MGDGPAPAEAKAAVAADAPATDEIVDDAQRATVGIRKAAMWIATALAAIPALGIVGNLIKGPGDAGFDGRWLFVGVIFAAGGAYLGIYHFAKVITPVPLEDRDLIGRRAKAGETEAVPGFDLTRLRGQPFESYGELIDALVPTKHQHARDQALADDAKFTSLTANSTATGAESIAMRAEADSSRAPSDANLKQKAVDARKEADVQRAAATASAEQSAAADQLATKWANQVQGMENIRTLAFHLKAADEVGSRFEAAKRWGIVAVALVAIGVFCIAMAPKQKSEPVATPTVSLVTLNLNPAGKEALGCRLNTIQAIRIGGTDAAPEVITLPTGSCKAQLVTFITESPEAYGTVVKATRLGPSSAPSGSP